MEARASKHVSGPRVIVLGGGLAGIVAALDCADGGARVTLLEVRPRLGGAAYSFQRDGLWLDNGQHVFLRCCTAYRALLERLGSKGRVAIQARLEIPVLSPGAKPTVLRRSMLPAPLHLAGALACYRHLSLRGRVRAAQAAFALSRLDLNETSARERLDQRALGEWLAEHGQGPASVAALWDLIALPTLNLPAAESSLGLGAFVLQTGLLESNEAGDIGFHLRPLQETIGDPAERALRHAGVEVRLGVRADAVDRVGTLRLRADGEESSADTVDRAGTLRVQAGGEELRADTVICALPHERAGGLLAPLLGARAKRWEGLGASPIINVHIVYDRHVCEQDFAAGVGTPVQYLFDRSDAAGLSNGGQYVAISLSGAGAEMGLAAERLGELYVEAMRELLPRAREAKVQSVHVSREHAATFAARPGTGTLRPAARTEVEGLVLAGAWTDTGWPATLEGAVLSGHAAAREALR
jgi:squalene-associated FAD-dependent desaturase